MLSPRRRTFLIGLFAFLAAGAAGIYGSPVSAYALEKRLQAAAEDALVRSGAQGWAEVRVHGQRAHLTGRAPSAQDHERVLLALWDADWSGGVVAGGITRIIDKTTLPRSRLVEG